MFLVVLFLTGQADGKPRIIGGGPTTSKSWPAIVSLQERGAPSAYWGHFCGGSLIQPRWVIDQDHLPAYILLGSS